MKLSTALPSLKEQGIEQLYPEPPPPPAAAATTGDESQSAESPRPVNYAYYLLKISKSLLLNFLEFVGILAVGPEQCHTKIEDLRNLFINAHHLLNLYRPHQARESLIMMMEEQLDRTREEIRQMDTVKIQVERVLEELGDEVEQQDKEQQQRSKPTAETSTTTATTSTADECRLMWTLLQEE